MKKEKTKFLIANLTIAILFSTVPTMITYGVLTLHGLNICRDITNQASKIESTDIKSLCRSSAINTTKSYIFLIGFFITLPTWLWIYLSMNKKRNKTSKKII
tara:strand:- start:30 stop:335 length:306 start_codon:yes stop_codon:yes gene_type:complete